MQSPNLDQSPSIIESQFFTTENETPKDDKALKDLAKTIQDRNIIFKDSNEYLQTEIKRTIIHRFCIDQNFEILRLYFESIIQFLEEQGKSEKDQLKELKQIVEKEDKFGNTPLMLACIYDYDAENKRADKYKCIRFLTNKLFANVNVVNLQSGFTPVHWLARHGNYHILHRLSNVSKLKPCMFLPDFLGYTPLDYAGKFNHWKIVAHIIKTTIDLIKHPDKVNFEFPPSLNLTDENLKVLLKDKYMLSNLLFWACCLDEKQLPSEPLVDDLLELGARPEWPMSINNKRCSLHMAAKYGHWTKLAKILNFLKRDYSDIKAHQSRQQLMETPNQIKQKNIKSIYSFKKDLKATMDQIFKDRKELIPNPWVDLVDEEDHSPLYLACQFNHPKIAKMLLILQGASLDLESKSGIRPRQLLQHDEVKQVFQEYYNNIDKAIRLKREDTASYDKFKDKPYDEDIVESIYQKDIKAQTNLREDQLRQHITNYHKVIEFYNQKIKTPQVEAVPKQDFLENILTNRNSLPELSTFAILVDISDEKKKNKINKNIKTLVDSKFIVRMFRSLSFFNSNQWFITLDLDQEVLEELAEDQEYQINLLEHHLKFAFNRSQKQEYEQFRTKDKQLLINEKLNKIINLENLRNEKIVKNVLNIHDIEDVNEILNNFKKQTLLSLLQQNFMDFKKQDYQALTSLKNYLGERWGFQYAFKYFFTCWLILPVIVALPCAISQYVHEVNEYSVLSLWSFWYSVMVCFWFTLLIEMWRRKENELKYIWGLSCVDTSAKGEIRLEYRGNEEFNYQNFTVSRKNHTKNAGLIFLANAFVFCGFISISVASFFLTKDYMGRLAGITNSIIIFITNFTYKKLLQLMTTFEDHKYQSDYTKSFIIKIFAFQIINANLSLITSIYQDRNLKKLNQLIIFQIGSNLVIKFGTQICLNYFKFNLFKFYYFFLVKRRASQQHERFQPEATKKTKETQSKKSKPESKTVEAVSQQDLSLYTKIIQEMQNQYLFSFLKQKVKNFPLFRAVTKFQSNGAAEIIELEPYFLDEIEVASCLVDQSFPDEIETISGNYILYFQAALFSFLCPMLTPMVFVYNCVTMPLHTYIHLRCMNRKTIIPQAGLGFWIYLLQYMSTLVVIFNCLFVFWFRDQFISVSYSALQRFSGLFPDYLISKERYFQDVSLLSVSIGNQVIGLTEKEMLDFLIIIVLFEHIAFLIKYLIHDNIGDTPGWILKKQERAKTQFDTLMQEKEKIKQEKECQRIKLEIEQDKRVYEEDMKQYNRTYYQISQQIQLESGKVKDIDAKIQQLEIYVEQERKAGERIKIAEEEVLVKEPRLFDFLVDRFDFEITKNQEKIDKIETNLHRQLMNRMFRQTYLYVERQVVMKRLATISFLDRRTLINCIDCQHRIAEYFCSEAECEFLCRECLEEQYEGSDHGFHRFNIPTATSGPALGSGMQLPSSFSKWQKFEKFNLPISEDNEFHLQLKKYFSLLKENYLTLNNIDQTGKPENLKVDVVKMLLDQNYNLLGENIGRQLINTFKHERQTSGNIEGINDFELDQYDHMSTSKAWYRANLKGGINVSTSFHGKISFNGEELLFLNRIGFYLMCLHGPKLQFNLFLKKLDDLQNGSWSDKVQILCELLKEGRIGASGKSNVKMIMVEHIVNFLMASIPQNISAGPASAEEVILKAFASKFSLDFYQVDRESKSKEMDKFKGSYLAVDYVESIIKGATGEFLEILRCIMQDRVGDTLG